MTGSTKTFLLEWGNFIMLCFEVEINGKEICRAGVGDFGVLSCGISWANSRNRPADTKVSLNVGGLMTPENQTGEFVTWVRESLAIGDEVSLKIVEAIDTDEPTERQPGDREPYCSFCGEVASNVSKIIEAQQVNICSECVAVCNQVLANNREPHFGGSAT